MTRSEALAKIEKLQAQINKLRLFANSRCKHANRRNESDDDGWSVMKITYTVICNDCGKKLAETKSDY